MYENNLILNKLNSIEEKTGKGKNFTLIEINSQKYAIETTNVLEIIKVMELDYSHRMPSYILGIITYEKMPLGVIDLREIFGKERVVYDISAKILVIKTPKNNCAIICDRVCDILKVDESLVKKMPYEQDISFFDGVYSKDNENVYIINVDNIIKFTKENSAKFENRNTDTNYIKDDEKTKEILKTRRNFMANIAAEVNTNQTPLYDSGVSFSINEVKYYINMASVKEFYKVNNSKFIKIPNTKDYIFGLTNIKGDYITVLDLRRFFSKEKTQIKEKSTIIILNSKEYKLGILADEICESMDISFDEIIQNRFQKQEENKSMEFVKDNEIYQVLDVEKLLRDERLTIA